MFIDLLSESARGGRGGGRGVEFLYRVTKMSQYFKDTFFRIILNFWLSFISYFSLEKLIGLGMPLFIRPYLARPISPHKFLVPCLSVRVKFTNQ